MKKNVLVTGGNSGIGYATAKLFSERGYAVTISGRNASRVMDAAQTLHVEGVVADVSNYDDVVDLASRFNETGLDVLVNNAAIARFMPLESINKADYDEFFYTNIRGPMLLMQSLLPALRKNGGSVVNISSIITNNGLPNASLYAATKGAIEAFTKSLALELAPQRIRVNAVSPGAVDTPLIAKLGLNEEQIKAARSQMESTIPLSRYAKPEEIAEVVWAQAESTYTTGAVWAVDGGVSAF